MVDSTRRPLQLQSGLDTQLVCWRCGLWGHIVQHCTKREPDRSESLAPKLPESMLDALQLPGADDPR